MKLTQNILKPAPQLTAIFVFILICIATPIKAQQHISLPRTGFTPNDIAIIINDDDPLSREVGYYYHQARKIPETHMIHVRFPAQRNTLSPKEFKQLKTTIDQLTPNHVQAYAVAWTAPYRVGCMSLTSALAFGFDKKYCATTCAPTASSSYFNTQSLLPYDDYKLRPAMMLAGTSFKYVKALIDKGIASDHSFPTGQAYLLKTSDKARSSRAAGFARAIHDLADVFSIQVLETNFISDRSDILFYFTGSTNVPMLETLDFLPGALADHLTSTGGMLTHSLQMSSLRWLEAGATASYGTVVEPCSYPQKFPFPLIAMFHYALGASAIEAYWKSVAWPGQGVFIGEPLAKPFAPLLQKVGPDQIEVRIFSPHASHLKIEESPFAAGPFKRIPQHLTIHRGKNLFRFKFDEKNDDYLRLQWN